MKTGRVTSTGKRGGRKQSLAKWKSEYREWRSYKQSVNAQPAHSLGCYIRNQDVAVMVQIKKMIIYYAYLLQQCSAEVYWLAVVACGLSYCRAGARIMIWLMRRPNSAFLSARPLTFRVYMSKKNLNLFIVKHNLLPVNTTIILIIIVLVIIHN